jgi:hypothetical protein
VRLKMCTDFEDGSSSEEGSFWIFGILDLNFFSLFRLCSLPLTLSETTRQIFYCQLIRIIWNEINSKYECACVWGVWVFVSEKKKYLIKKNPSRNAMKKIERVDFQTLNYDYSLFHSFPPQFHHWTTLTISKNQSVIHLFVNFTSKKITQSKQVMQRKKRIRRMRMKEEYQGHIIKKNETRIDVYVRVHELQYLHFGLFSIPNRRPSFLWVVLHVLFEHNSAHIHTYCYRQSSDHSIIRKNAKGKEKTTLNKELVAIF